jgi:hypothetical protein
LLPFQPPLLGTTNVQPDASCLPQFGYHHLLGAKGIIGLFLKPSKKRKKLLMLPKGVPMFFQL